MPFTLSHAAAVLPFHKFSQKYFCFSALVIGSMTPDFAYFWTDFNLASRAHTSMGVPFICLPLGIIAYFLIRSFAKHIAKLCYDPFDRIFLQMAESKPTMLSIILSVSLGAWTHNCWDGFTHKNGWFVAKIPFLKAVLFSGTQQQIALYSLLQQLSTIIGLIVVLYFSHKIANLLPKNEASLRYKSITWLLIFLSAFTALILQFHLVPGEQISNFDLLRKNSFTVVVLSIRNLIVCTSVSIGILWFLESKNRQLKQK